MSTTVRARPRTRFLAGFWKLTWVEIKVFVREPLGVFGAIAMPAVMFLLLGRAFGVAGPRPLDTTTIAGELAEAPPFNVAILAAILIALGAVQSLVAIISIYREGGILKRLRATPLSPVTILGAHVAVKLGFSVISLMVLMLAGRRIFPGVMDVDLVAFAAALTLSTLSILSLGFVIASMVPTARFAQLIGAAVLYPMLAVSGLFYPLEQLPTWIQRVAWWMPTTHAVALLQGVWAGAGWRAEWTHAAMLGILFVVLSAIATRVFRWE